MPLESLRITKISSRSWQYDTELGKPMFSWKQHLEARPNTLNSNIWYLCLGNWINPCVSVVQWSHFGKKNKVKKPPQNQRKDSHFPFEVLRRQCIYLKHKDSSEGQAERLWAPFHADSFLDRRYILKHVHAHEEKYMISMQSEKVWSLKY